MDIEKYTHLWDGSEEGWTLYHIDHVVWNITYLFSPNGPSKDEILALRKVIPEFKEKPLSAVLKKVKGIQSYEVKHPYGNIDSKQLEREVINLGLRYKINATQIGGHLPVSKENVALVIEDEQVNIAVCEKMLKEGVPVICHTHVD